MKKQTLWILQIGLIATMMFTACSGPGQLPETVPAVTPQVTPTAPPVETVTAPTEEVLLPTATKPATPTATSPAPQATPTKETSGQEISAGVTFDYQAIPLGEELVATVNGRKISIKVNKVTTGSEADTIAQSKAPEEMQWMIIQLMIKYLEGETKTRVQVVEYSMFDIVSKGHLAVSSPWFSYLPSPHLDDVTLLPGEQSLGYLAYQVYQDDPAPLLRFDLREGDRFFALAGDSVPPVETESEIQLAGSAGVGSKDQPVPVGTPAYVRQGETVYKITVQKALRGYNALKKIKDGFGINDDPPEGKEFLMPYVSVSVARPGRIYTIFLLSTLSSFSNQEQLGQPDNFFCPLPCMQSATLYPNGNISGWVPLLSYTDDLAPLLVFDNEIYFSVVSEQDSEMAYQRQFSPDAIGYPNRNNIKPFMELKQVGPVNAIAFSPDDELLVTAGDDKTLHVWSIANGEELYAKKSHRGSIKQISFSADGMFLASVSNIGELIVWDTAVWEPVQTFDLKGNGLGAKFYPDGSLMGANTSGVLNVWDIQGGQLIRQEFIPRNASPTCATAAVHSFDASDDGSILAASLSCGFGVIWEQGSTKILFAVSNFQDELKLRGKPIPTTSKIVLSPDGKMAAYGMFYKPEWQLMLLSILDIENQHGVSGVNPIDVNVITAKIAPNKDLIFAGVGSQVFIWWPEAFVWGGDNLIQLTDHKIIVTTLQFSTRGEILASGDYSGRTILWSAK